MLDRVRVRKRRGEEVTVAGAFRPVLGAKSALRDEGLDVPL